MGVLLDFRVKIEMKAEIIEYCINFNKPKFEDEFTQILVRKDYWIFSPSLLTGWPQIYNLPLQIKITVM